MQGKDTAIKMLFGLQRRLENAGIDPYVSNILALKNE